MSEIVEKKTATGGYENGREGIFVRKTDLSLKLLPKDDIYGQGRGESWWLVQAGSPLCIVDGEEDSIIAMLQYLKKQKQANKK